MGIIVLPVAYRDRYGAQHRYPEDTANCRLLWFECAWMGLCDGRRGARAQRLLHPMEGWIEAPCSEQGAKMLDSDVAGTGELCGG